MTRPVATVLCVVGALAVGAPVRADGETTLEADTSFVADEVRSPGTGTIWRRRRLVQTVGFGYAHRLDEARPAGPRVLTRVRLRLDRDFGDTCRPGRMVCVRAHEESDLADYQPLAREGRVDAPEASVEIAGLPAGAALVAGRSLRVDPVGMSRLDGAQARVSPASWLRVEAFGGLQVRDATPLGADAWEPPGSLRLDLPGDLTEDRVEFVAEPSRTWLAGAGVTVGPLRGIVGRATFRERQDGDGLVDRRLGLSLGSGLEGPLAATATAVVDLAQLGIVDARTAVSVRRGPVRVTAAYEHHEPRFDLGTIWAWFDVAPVDRVRLSATWTPGATVRVSGGVAGRRVDLGQAGDALDGVLDAALSFRLAGLDLHVSAFGTGGDLAPFAGVSASADRPVHPRVSLRARASVFHFEDALRSRMHGTSFSEALGARIRVTDQTTLEAEAQHVASRLVGHRFRVVASLGVEVAR